MAFLKTINYRGLIIQNAFHRIDVTTSSNGICEATLNIYISKNDFEEGKGYLEQRQVNYPIEYGLDVGADKNQGYDYLLSLEEYKDSLLF